MKTFDLIRFRLHDPCVLALGFFDCVHLGHKKVIFRATAIARKLGVKSAVFLFKNNIYELLGMEKTPLFSFDERLAEIEKLGVDEVYYIHADKDMLNASPEAFVGFLKDRLNICGVVCGEDYSFGYKGEGKASDLLAAFPKGQNEIVPICCENGEKIGSGRIKSLLSEGNVSFAAKLLGRPYSVKGIVEPGRRDGAKIGFPTLNLKNVPSVLKLGVYFTNTMIDGKLYRSVSNVGSHPTFGDLSVNVETHLLDFGEDAYGKEITVYFLDWEREIVRFDSIEQLKNTLSENVRKRREYD